ncbi:MAG: DNA-directed RNA polymerase subunit omega [Acidobacteriaceae bacterium]
MMRSELVTGALEYVPNRFLLTRLAATAIRAFHRPNTRIADTANDVLRRFNTKSPIVLEPKSSRLAGRELRRAS